MTKKPAQVFHFDLYGKRDDKYSFLNENSIKTIPFTTLQPQEPELFFVPKDFGVAQEYNLGIKINELFTLNGVGICTKRDKIAYHKNIKDLRDILIDFKDLDENEIRLKYNIFTESRDQKISYAKNNINNFGIEEKYFKKCRYRPFDDFYTYYTNKSKGFLAYPVYNVLQHLSNDGNFGLIVPRQCASDWRYCFITNTVCDLNLIGTAGSFGAGNIFPLYLYPETTNQKSLLEEVVRTPNLKMEIVNQISEKLGIPFVAEKSPSFGWVGEVFAPIDILDYIYAVLHSPSYREKYKEFLKIDFPRVPHPKDQKTFFDLVALGSELRQIHLLESEIVEKYITQYPEDGNNEVGKIHFEITDLKGFENSLALGNVHINENQYFANVPEVAWNFYIGGYQPAQKWLKDRKGRELGYEDILHYQKIIVALTQTDRLMKEIDKIEI